MKKLLVVLAAALLLTGCNSSAGNETQDSTAQTEQTPAETHENSGTAEAPTDEKPTQNGVYVADGYAAKIEPQLNKKSIEYAAKRFNFINEKLLGNCGKAYLSIIPDKNYFLAEANGYPALDYERLVQLLTEKTAFAEYLDIFPFLVLEDYYHTDTHWRQEKITDIAEFLAEKMGASLTADYTEITLENPFYGVHCRQAELDIAPDTLAYLDSPFLSECTVIDGETNSETTVYNMELAAGNDPYEIFLSGAKSLMTIKNPNAPADKRLIIFRDSFAGAIAPLLAEGYSEITLIDIRYLSPALLDRFVSFDGQDVLFLYSVPVLNNAETFK